MDQPAYPALGCRIFVLFAENRRKGLNEKPVLETPVETLRAVRDSLAYLIRVAQEAGLEEVVTALKGALAKVESEIRRRLV
jgi:hypothetical protein